ncbi:MAG TPA: NUDIX domain-containing protein [Ramlibacter sp.]|nr:NUDIX domain-containing protein [Ramlibacter sp.]
MSRPYPDAAWLAALRAGADRPPRHPRIALWAGEARIGSVEPDFFGPLTLPAGLLTKTVRGGEAGWQIDGDVTAGLHVLAMALRAAGLAHVWRDEQLAVTDENGRRLGTVERAVVRPLGITTFAVHLIGLSPDGRHWVQQRSLTKANDPGLWDTLMGGMIPATDSLAQALERETWEEAGLRLDQLAQLRHGGRITVRRPTSEIGAGYVVEHADWYRCVVPTGVVPANQDGEVAQFRLMDGDEVAARLERDEFTIEAALILAEAAL